MRARAGSDATLLVLLLVFALAVRLITLPMVDAGGDAMIKWYHAKILLGAAPGPWIWNHHTARLGVVVPACLVQALFGTHPVAYYLPALLMALALVCLVFRVGVRLVGRTIAFWASVALVLAPEMRLSGAQLLPGVFSATYVLASFYCLALHGDESRRGTLFLYLSALAFFLAYLSKITNLFFLPGFVAAAWLLGRQTRDAFVFAGLVGGLILLETGLYSGLSGHDFGRFSIALGTRSPRVGPLDSFTDLFRRYAVLTDAWKLLVSVYFLSTLVLLGAAARRRLDPAALAVALIPAGFFLGLTFGVRSLDPLVPAQGFHARYLTAALPFVVLVPAVCLRRFARPCLRLPKWLPRGLSGFALVLLALCVWQYATRFPGLEWHPMTLLAQYRPSVEAFARGAPLLEEGRMGLGIKTWLSLFWERERPSVYTFRLDGRVFRVASVGDPEAVLRERIFGGEILIARAIPLPGTDSYRFELERTSDPLIPIVPPPLESR